MKLTIPKLKLRRVRWVENLFIREEILIAWLLTLALLQAVTGWHRPMVGLFVGLNVGFAIQKIMDIRIQRVIRKARLQDEIDLRTMADIVERATYKTLHEMDKARFN
jgi:hypothetical protein